MAEPEGEQPPARTGGGGGGSFFTRRLWGIPTWVLMAAGLGVALALSAYRSNKAKASAGGTGTGPASGSAAAGTMASQVPPFIIQNYPNSPVAPAAAPTPATGLPASTPNAPQVVSAGHNQTVQSVIDWAHQNGFPAYSWADFWALNPSIPGLANTPQGWTLTQWGTPITLAKPGYISAGTSNGGISADSPNQTVTRI